MFSNFIDNEWDDCMVYWTTDFVDLFGISRHLARHYLFDVFVRKERRLFRAKSYNKAYYFKATDINKEEVEEWRYTGIKIEYK
jgi:hypothetical protein